MVNAKLRYQKIKELREILNGYPLQSPSTGGLDNETEIYICAMPSVSGNTEPYRNEPWRSIVSLWAAFLGNEAHFYKVATDELSNRFD